METKRQRQVAEAVKRHFSLVLQSEGSYIYGAKPLVTVTNVKVSPDLSIASVYLSIWNTDNKQAVILMMDEEEARLKSAFGYRVRKHLRRVPDLAFYLDETLDEMYRVENLFERLHANDQMPKEDSDEDSQH
jgi:ribosome-binding factor A